LGDYAALYPNCIILANLGIDSVRDFDDGNCYKININFVDKYLMAAILEKVDKGIALTTKETNLMNTNNTPKYVYFSKNVESVYANMISNVLA
jgi:hypothetical protein